MLAIDPATGKAPTSGRWGPGNVDRNGLAFGGNILEYVSPGKDNNGQWVVVKAVMAGDDQEVFDWNRAETVINNPCNPTVRLGIPDRYVNDSRAWVCSDGGAPAPRETRWMIGSYAIHEIPLVGQFGIFYPNRQME